MRCGAAPRLLEPRPGLSGLLSRTPLILPRWPGHVQEAGDLLEQRSCHGRWRFRGPQAAFAEQPNFLSTGLSCADESGAPRCVQNQIFALKKKARMVVVDQKPRSTKQKGLWSPAWGAPEAHRAWCWRRGPCHGVGLQSRTSPRFICSLQVVSSHDFFTNHLPSVRSSSMGRRDVANPNLAPRCLLTWRKQVCPPLFSAGAMRSGTELRSGALGLRGLV